MFQWIRESYSMHATLHRLEFRRRPSETSPNKYTPLFSVRWSLYNNIEEILRYIRWVLLNPDKLIKSLNLNTIQLNIQPSQQSLRKKLSQLRTKKSPIFVLINCSLCLIRNCTCMTQILLLIPSNYQNSITHRHSRKILKKGKPGYIN